jgi:DNA topoisomerase I
MTFTIESIEKKKITKNPPAAFTTSTLQQECSSQLKLSPTETMTIAQSLYENSHITYMRTDSAILGQLAQNISIATIEDHFTKQFVHSQYLTETEDQNPASYLKKKQLNAQEAHEAIRPTTKFISFPDGTTKERFVEPNATGLVGLEKKLYELIYQRTLASVMAPAVFETSTFNIQAKVEGITETQGNNSGSVGIFKANERKMIFPGYQMISKINQRTQTFQTDILNSSSSSGRNQNQNQEQSPKVGEQIFLSTANPNLPNTKLENLDEEDENDEMLQQEAEQFETTDPAAAAAAAVALGSLTSSNGIIVTAHKTAPPLRYSEATFIRELEAVGVGRPSTYASIIQTLEERGYILVDKRTIIPTVKGIVVSNLLSKYFPEIILPEFTSKMETNLDLIAQGKLNRTNYLKSFYLGEQQTSILNPTQSPLGLKFKAIEVNNERNRLGIGMGVVGGGAGGRAGGSILSGTASSTSVTSGNEAFDYKILDIKTLQKFGRLFYTGDEELILEKEISLPSSSASSSSVGPPAVSASSAASPPSHVPAAVGSADSIGELRQKIQRWKLSIGDDIRKLSEEYLEEVQQRACEGADYCPSLIPPFHNRALDRHTIPHGKLIGKWKDKDIFLREGRYGPYLDYEGFFW